MFFFGVRQVVSQNQTLNIQPEPDSQKLKSETNKLAASGLEKRHRLKIKRQVFWKTSLKKATFLKQAYSDRIDVCVWV